MKKVELDELRKQLTEMEAEVIRGQERTAAARATMQEAKAELAAYIDIDKAKEPQVAKLRIEAEQAVVRALSAYKRLKEKVDDARERNEQPQPADR